MTPESETEPSQAKRIADLLFSRFGEEHGFDLETCDEIGDMPFEQAFETAYGYLVQADVDADEALADFIEEP